MTTPNTKWQIVWGVLLCLAGISVFFRVYQLGPRIDDIAGQPSTALFARICIYIMGFVLIGGGLKKIWHHYLESRKKKGQAEQE
jgi:uncharacterized membrane protein HdeD (DUF308 family)